MVRILGSTGSRRRRRYQLGALVSLVALLAVLAVPNALAVHDLGVFQLDKNASTAVQSSPTALEDWDLICKAHPSTCTFASGYSVPSGTTVADPNQFVTDPSESAQDDILKGGTKDDNDIPSWKWASAKPSPPKNDITHAFAAEYTCKGSEANSVAGCTGNTGDKLLYFGGDRFSNSGSANLAFWFFQNKIEQLTETGQPVGPGNLVCGLGSGCPFSGTHKAGEVPHDPTNVGDILVISAFGPKAQIQVFEWVGVGNAPAPCFTNTCSLVPLIPATAGQACEDVTADNACATVNDVVTPSPWTLSQKNAPADSFQPTNFFEGGLNLTNLGLANACFSSFLLNTRASASGNAELHDKVIGQFGRCGSGLVTTPKDGSGGAIPGGGLSIGTGSVSVKDSANLTVTGISTWSGSLSFFLCGPIASPATCTSGGTAIGSAIAVTQATSQPVLSTAATVTSAGRYCWRAEFTSSTTGLPDAKDDTAGECFVVNPVTPALDTAAVASPVNLGDAVQDNATLSGTSRQPGSPIIDGPLGALAGGKITFTLLKANCTDLATGTGTNPQDVTVSGNGTYGPVSFTPDAVGTYHWKAQYIPATGDPNNLGSTHNGSCTDTDEAVVVQSFPTTTTTRQFVFPQDKAKVTVTGGGDLAGNLTFKLYDTLANCQANTATGLLYTEGPLAVSGAAPQFKTTSNTTVRVSTSTTVYWRVTYVSTNGAQTGSSSACAESTAVTFTGDDGTIDIP